MERGTRVDHTIKNELPPTQWIRTFGDMASEQSPQLDFLRGTFAPLLRASDRPIAIACLRLVTTPPLPFFPERSFPRFSRCSACLTLSLAALPYFAISPPPSELSSITAIAVHGPALIS
jgi:hypothetical protein